MTQKNYDLNELQHFEEHAGDWWNPEGPFKTLHDIQPTRLALIESITSLKKKRVLDIGCGGGILTEDLAKKGAEVTGIDLSKTAIDTARAHCDGLHGKHTEKLSIHYQLSSAEDFATEHAHAFDIVTCLELLEHVPNPQSLIKACAKLVKPEGFVFFSTINRTLKAYALAILGAEYILKLLPRGTHHYEKFLKPHELVNEAEKCGLTLKTLKGLQYQPITRKAYLNDSLSVNYLACFQNEKI